MSALDNISASVGGAFGPLQSRLEPLLDSLSPRDRMLLLGLSVFGGLLLIAGVGWWMTSSLDGLRSDIDDRKEALAFVRQEIAEYEASQEQLILIEEELKKHEGTDFSAFMEKAAESADMKDQLSSVRPTSTTTVGSLEVKNYDVKVNRVSLPQFLDFLYQVETDGYPLRITNAKLKGVTVSGAKLLNVTLEVSAFRLLIEEE